jgi:hypothetical protein
MVSNSGKKNFAQVSKCQVSHILNPLIFKGSFQKGALMDKGSFQKRALMDCNSKNH